MDDQMCDLEDRLIRAAAELSAMADIQRGLYRQNAARLYAKAEGVRLALSYVEEVRRGR